MTNILNAAEIFTISVRSFTHRWNESAQSYDRQSIPELPEGYSYWMGATCRSFNSVAGAKRSIRASKEVNEFIITEEKFTGRGDKVQVWVAIK